MGFVPNKGNMKTTIALLIALTSTLTATNVRAGDTASCCKNSAAALSPRAQANQTVVVAGKGDTEIARADLGTGARTKAFGGHAAIVAGTAAKDVDLVHDRSLGVAAKAKATGNTGSATLELAPLK